jgi:small ligand-binding sensory domain FIST
MEANTKPMKWVNSLSTRPSLEAAIDEVVRRSQEALQTSADLAIVFISSTFASDFPRLMPLLRERLGDLPLIGCSGGGIVGTTPTGQTREIETEPSISLTLASLPNVKVQTFHLNGDDLPDLDSPPNSWMELLEVEIADQPNFMLLADPLSSRVNDLLQGLDFAYSGSAKVGGLVSSSNGGSGSALFCDYRLHREGTVGVALSGKIVLETIVAQGCRPIGQPYLVTEGERNILLALEEEPDTTLVTSSRSSRISQKRTPLEVLQNLIQTLNEEDRELAQHSLFIGVAQNEFKQTLEPGDFLIRNLLGVDPRLGAIAIGDRIRPGQRIQFHLRDAEASAQDLETLLERYQKQGTRDVMTAGAFMFSCMGRGEGLYGDADFDSSLFHHYLPGIPLSGFFCSGEIGPVGNNTFLHGYTSVFGIYHPT